MTTSSASAAEVIVVGGGPAGAVTALLLARAGHDVLLVDRAPFPRPKPCGDCLSVGATAILERSGLLADVLARPHALLRGWRIVSPDGSTFAAHFAPHAPAIAIARSELDAVLLDAARTAGARILTARVTDVLRADRRVCGVIAGRHTLRAPLVVGADGLRSIVAARLGLRGRPRAPRKLSLTFHPATITGCDGLGEMHCGDGFCAGVAPVSDGRSNLTIVAAADRFGRAIAQDPRRTALALISRLPRLAGRVPPGALEGLPLASGPFHRPVARVAVDGAVLVGDAAGYYDPFTGQGVFQALAAAELLAPCIAAALRAGRTDAAAFDDYGRRRRRLLRGARLLQRAIEIVLARPATANRLISRIARAPALARTLIAVTGDVEPPARLLSPAVLSGFLLPLPETP